MENIFGTLEARKQPEVMKTLETLVVRDIMERRFVVLHPQTPLREAINLFLEKGLEGAPVAQENSLKGLLTHQDVIRVFEEKALELSQHRKRTVNYEKEFRALGDKKIGEVMRQKVFVAQDNSIFDAMTVMDENNVEIVPAIDETGKIQGVLSDGVILKTILRFLV